MNRRRNRLFSAILLSFVVLFVLVFGELAARYLMRHGIALIRDVDHRLTPNVTEINSDGIRSAKESHDFAPDDVNVIFLGDSFVYGYWEYPHSAFPQQFERMMRSHYPDLSINVANFGWTSSSPYLSLRLLEDIGSKYSPDIVFLCIDVTDFYDDLRYQNLIERPTMAYRLLSFVPGYVLAGKAVLRRLSKYELFAQLYESAFGIPIDRFFIVNQPLEKSRAFCKNIISNIDRIEQYVTHELNAKFALVILPRSFQYSDRECPANWEADGYEELGPYVEEPFKLFDELERDRSYPVHSLLDVFRNTEIFPTCLYNDPHWNADGHRLAAEAIVEIAEKDGLLVAK